MGMQFVSSSESRLIPTLQVSPFLPGGQPWHVCYLW